VKAWHPDRFPGDEKSKNAAQEKLKAINFAYSYLNYLSANTPDYSSKPAPASTNTREPAQRNQTTAGNPPQANRPSPWSNSSGHASRKSTWLNNLFSKFPAARRLGYLFYLIPLILLVVGVFNSTSSNRSTSSTTSMDATSPAVPSQNNGGGNINRPPSGLTPVPLDQKDIELMPDTRLRNGEELSKRKRLNGLGELTVENGTGYDAVVLLVELNTEKTIRNFYVTAGNTFTEPRIAPGLYTIYFVTGTYWNPELKAFNSSANYSQFGRNVEFSEKPDQVSGKIKYSTYKITLQPVVDGNATIYSSNKDTFNKLMNDASTN
jgi:curved DNA-binding protein CbpA